MARGVQFKFDSDIDHLAKFVRSLEKGAASEAAKALNRVPKFVKDETGADISARTGIPANVVKRRLKPIKAMRASPSRLRIVGFVGEATVPVSKLKPKPRKAGRGVSYKTITGQPHNPHAFFATLSNGKRTAWVRKTRARGSMREIQVDIKLLLRRNVRRLTKAPAQRFFEATFLANMDKRVKKMADRKGISIT